MEASILNFWFGADINAISREHTLRWFRSDSSFDQEIAQRFGKLHKAAVQGAFRDWCDRPRGRLALLILLDQFSRNLNRESPLAWAQDHVCQEIAIEGVDIGQDRELHPIEAVFFYMPFQHSENLEHQERSVTLYQSLCERFPSSDAARRSLESAQYHRDLVAKFGRFAHRNRILDRANTPEETAYLNALPEGKAF